MTTPITPLATETGKKKFEEVDWNAKLTEGWGDFQEPNIQNPAFGRGLKTNVGCTLFSRTKTLPAISQMTTS
jgi:hypothetical protein